MCLLCLGALQCNGGSESRWGPEAGGGSDSATSGMSFPADANSASRDSAVPGDARAEHDAAGADAAGADAASLGGDAAGAKSDLGSHCTSPVLPVSVTYNVAPSHPLAHVRSFAFILSDPAGNMKMQRLAASTNDLAVIDNVRNLTGSASYDAAGVVQSLHATTGEAGHPKVVLQYVELGEAMKSRYYWNAAWTPGNPDWILGSDPDGYTQSFLVAYWNQQWKDVLFSGTDSMVDRAIADGFDGVYLDVIEAALDSTVIAKATADGVDPNAEMVKLLSALRAHAHAKKPNFLLMAANATDLRMQPGYLAQIDAELQEEIFFDGLGNVSGTDPRQGDCRLPLRVNQPMPSANASYCSQLVTMKASSEQFLTALPDYLKAGIPVFGLDYALVPADAQLSYEQFSCYDIVGSVAMRSLEDLTATPGFW